MAQSAGLGTVWCGLLYWCLRLVLPDLLPRLAALRADPARTRELRQAWREHIRSGHAYSHRVAQLRDTLGI